MLLGYKPTWVEYDDSRLRLRVVKREREEKDDAPPMHQDPRWLRLVDVVMRALMPFAEAREAVCRELTSATGLENSS